MKSISATAFEYNGQLIDTVQMAYDSRNCGGAMVHRVGSAIMILAAIADELHRGMEVDGGDVGAALVKYRR